MRPFLFVLLVAGALVATAGTGSAEIVYYIEDFENNGVAGFDTTHFHHQLSAEPPRWEFVEWPVGVFNLVLTGATDTISFNLSDFETVVYGSVSIVNYGVTSYTSVRFIGLDGTWQTGPADYGKEFVDVTADMIGPIESIELSSSQGVFYNITIGVVPEPGGFGLLLLLTGSAVAMGARIWPRRS